MRRLISILTAAALALTSFSVPAIAGSGAPGVQEQRGEREHRPPSGRYQKPPREHRYPRGREHRPPPPRGTRWEHRHEPPPYWGHSEWEYRRRYLHRHDYDDDDFDESFGIVAGVILGFVLGAAIADSEERQTYAYRRLDDPDWLEYC